METITAAEFAKLAILSVRNTKNQWLVAFNEADWNAISIAKQVECGEHLLEIFLKESGSRGYTVKLSLYFGINTNDYIEQLTSKWLEDRAPTNDPKQALMRVFSMAKNSEEARPHVAGINTVILGFGGR